MFVTGGESASDDGQPEMRVRPQHPENIPLFSFDFMICYTSFVFWRLCQCRGGGMKAPLLPTALPPQVVPLCCRKCNARARVLLPYIWRSYPRLLASLTTAAEQVGDMMTLQHRAW